MFTGRGRENRARVYDFIRSWSEEHGYPPSIREICRGVGIASTKAVKYHLDALVSSGLVRRNPRQARAIEIAAQPFRLPLVGRIAAGSPALAVENVEEHFTLERFRDCFMLRVRGDSMSGIGIMDSDLVIVQPQDTARSGDIVAALLDNEATVKRFTIEGERVVLQPENPQFEAIPVEPAQREFRLIGRVVGVLRRYG